MFLYITINNNYMDGESFSNQIITLITPAFNEEKNLRVIVESGLRLVREGSVNHFYVIDDGSTDRTARIAQDMGAAVHSVNTNLGKAEAIFYGVLLAKRNGSDVLISIDADLCTPLNKKHIKNFIDCLNGRNDDFFPADVAVYPTLELGPDFDFDAHTPRFTHESRIYSGSRAFRVSRCNFLFTEKDGTFEFSTNYSAARYHSVTGYGLELLINHDTYCRTVDNYKTDPINLQKPYHNGREKEMEDLDKTRKILRERERQYEGILRNWFKDGKHTKFGEFYEREMGTFVPKRIRFGNTFPQTH